MTERIMAADTQVSTRWYDLFEKYKDLELEPTDYFSLDKLDAVPDLQFLKGLCWAQVRDWIKHDRTPMSRIPHRDLDGPGELFIGGMNDALNDAALDANDIRAVVSIHPKDLLAWDPEDPEYGLRRFTEGTGRRRAHLMIPLSDDSKENLLDHLPAAQEFLEEHLKQGENVLVHCKSGRSRSVAVLVAYLQRKYWRTQLQPLLEKGDGLDSLAKLETYRNEVIAQVQEWRLPVVLIMDRFLPLLKVYDLELTEDPGYETARAKYFPDHTSQKEKKSDGGNAVKAVGAVLKLAVAIAFFEEQQKPLRSVVERFFSVRDEYYPELEGLWRDDEGDKYDYRGAGHAKPGVVEYYVRFAEEYGIVVPEAARDTLVRARAQKTS